MQETQYDKTNSDLFRFRKSVMIFVAKVKKNLYTFLQIQRPLCAKGNFFYIWPRIYILHIGSESKKKIRLKIVIGGIILTLCKSLQIIFIEFKKTLKAIVIKRDKIINTIFFPIQIANYRTEGKKRFII